MKVSTLTVLMVLVADPTLAFTLDDAINTASAIQNQSGHEASVQTPLASARLLNVLGSELKVTPEQALGGASAMLGMARNNLDETQYNQLIEAAPGLDMLATVNAFGGLRGLDELLGQNSQRRLPLANALGNVGDLDDLVSAFKALEMDGAMIDQFAPLLLQYLAQQGIAGSLLQSLGALWSAPAAGPSV